MIIVRFIEAWVRGNESDPTNCDDAPRDRGCVHGSSFRAKWSGVPGQKIHLGRGGSKVNYCSSEVAHCRERRQSWEGGVVVMHWHCCIDQRYACTPRIREHRIIRDWVAGIHV